MKRAVPLLLLAAVACSAFENRRIVQHATAIEALANTSATLLEQDNMTVEQASLIHAALSEAKAALGRYWEAKAAGVDYATRKQIIDAVKSALQRAEKMLAEVEE